MRVVIIIIIIIITVVVVAVPVPVQRVEGSPVGGLDAGPPRFPREELRGRVAFARERNGARGRRCHGPPKL